MSIEGTMVGGKENTPRGDGLALLPESEQVRALAQANLGLYHPSDLDQALTAIAQKANASVWTDRLANAKDHETVAYFLGEEIGCKVWQMPPAARNPALPFLGVEKLTLPPSLQDPLNPPHILLMGCAGIESFKLEQRVLKQLNVPTQRHTVLDFSALPLQRIHAMYPEQSLLKADAAQMPLAEESVDLITSDLMLGSLPPEKEKEILTETKRVLKDNGQLVMRASLLSDEHVTTFASIMPHVGSMWGAAVKGEYGETTEGRDGLIGLTPEQWRTFGSLYGGFVEKNYFGQNRFKSTQQLESTLTESGFHILEQHLETRSLGTDEPFSYIAIRAQKADPK